MHCNVISLTLCLPTSTPSMYGVLAQAPQVWGSRYCRTELFVGAFAGSGQDTGITKVRDDGIAVGSAKGPNGAVHGYSKNRRGIMVADTADIGPLCVHEDPSLKLIISEATTADVFQQADITISILSPY